MPREGVPSPGASNYESPRTYCQRLACWHNRTRTSPEAADRRCDHPVTSAVGVHSTARYRGAESFRQRKARRDIFNSICDLMSSQCNCLCIESLIWSERFFFFFRMPLNPIRQTFIPRPYIFMPLLSFTVLLSTVSVQSVPSHILSTCLLHGSGRKQRLSLFYAAANQKPGILSKTLAQANFE